MKKKLVYIGIVLILLSFLASYLYVTSVGADAFHINNLGNQSYVILAHNSLVNNVTLNDSEVLVLDYRSDVNISFYFMNSLGIQKAQPYIANDLLASMANQLYGNGLIESVPSAKVGSFQEL